MEANGVRVIHLYGRTEGYGPATVCAWQETWGELGLQDRSAKMARQGVNYLTLEAAEVIDAGTRSEEHTSELQSLMRISYAVFCLKKKKKNEYSLSESTHNQTKTSEQRREEVS